MKNLGKSSFFILVVLYISFNADRRKFERHYYRRDGSLAWSIDQRCILEKWTDQTT